MELFTGQFLLTLTNRVAELLKIWGIKNMKLAATTKTKVLKHLEYWDVFIFMNIYLLISQKP